MNNNHNIGKAFEKILSEMYFVHKGLRFEKTSAGFVHNGILCRTHEDMDLLVEQERHSLSNTIHPKHDDNATLRITR